MIKPTSGARLGITLIELLLVIFVIGVLLALLLPAVRTGQESSRRAVCQNNLKNITLAALGFVLLGSTILIVMLGYRLVGRDFMLRRS